MRLKLLGTAVLLIGFVQCSFGGIYSGCIATTGPTACTFDGTGNVNVTGATSISWNSDNLGSIANLFTFSGGTNVYSVIPNGSQEGIANIGPEPVGATFGAIPFITFPTLQLPAGAGLLLTFIQQGLYSTTTCGGAAAAGQTCTPALSGTNPGPFSFVNFNDPNFGLSSSATFSFAGVSVDGSGKWSGIYTSQFLGQSFQSVLNQLATTGTVSNAYSQATLTVSSASPGVPEPGSVVMIGSGLIGLAAILRRRRSAK
jgi:PEP-CTERM motif